MKVQRNDGSMVHEGNIARIVFRLTPPPDNEWAALFGGRGGGALGGRQPPGYEHPMSIPHPELNGDLVVIEVPTGQVEKHVAKLDERIKATNDAYEREVAPRLERQRQAQAEVNERARQNEQSDRNALDEMNRKRTGEQP